MRSRVKVRTTVNRRTIRDIQETDADAMGAMGEDFLRVVRVPDAPPLGRGLVETGAYVVTRDGQHRSGDAEVPRSSGGRGAFLAAGFGFPGRFLEFGTVKMSARPFVTPAYLEVVNRRVKYLREAHRRRGR